MLDQMNPMYPTNQLLKIGVAQRPSSDGDSFKKISDAITRALQDAGPGNIPQHLSKLYIPNRRPFCKTLNLYIIFLP